MGRFVLWACQERRKTSSKVHFARWCMMFYSLHLNGTSAGLKVCPKVRYHGRGYTILEKDLHRLWLLHLFTVFSLHYTVYHRFGGRRVCLLLLLRIHSVNSILPKQGKARKNQVQNSHFGQWRDARDVTLKLYIIV